VLFSNVLVHGENAVALLSSGVSLGKRHKKVEICQKFSTKCGWSFFIIWSFLFPDASCDFLQWVAG
jgi:hypothetical protein